jgi:flagellar FliL protein
MEVSMSEPTNSPETENDAPKKKGKLMIIVILLVLILAGGGAGGYFYFSGSSGEKSEESAKNEKKESSGKTKKSKSEKEEEEEEPEPKKPEKKSKGPSAKKSLETSLPEDEGVKHIVDLQPFIVNLADEGEARYLRMTVSVGVGEHGGGESEKADPLFITRVRNAMLAVLSIKTSEEILTIEGKAKLRKELLKAAQAASEEPHVEAIYITDFIVQL